METDARFTEADLRLIERDYKTLDQLCPGRELTPGQVEAMIANGELPQPAYVLPDGRRMFPQDYFQLYDETAEHDDSLEASFRRRFSEAAQRAALDFTEEWNPDSEWADYIDGTYWVCLNQATPEMIIEKERWIRAIAQAMDHPEPESERWRESLRSAVRALDSIERPFTDFDRARWDYTSRERYISTPTTRYPAVFAS
jgi:Family of unknown function (DUF6058)